MKKSYLIVRRYFEAKLMRKAVSEQLYRSIDIAVHEFQCQQRRTADSTSGSIYPMLNKCMYMWNKFTKRKLTFWNGPVPLLKRYAI